MAPLGLKDTSNKFFCSRVFVFYLFTKQKPFFLVASCYKVKWPT